jgi:hypothetical protein
MPIDYEKLERAARDALSGPLNRLRGALQVWTMFLAAYEIGKELAEKRREMSGWAKHAFTLAMAVEYSKPWSRNNEPTVKNLDKTFLRDVEADPRHEELRQYRNQAGAHLDRGVQALGTTLEGPRCPNDTPSPRRFPYLCVPVRARADVGVALGLDSDADIRSLTEHVKAALDATRREVSTAGAEVVEVARGHAPVLDRLQDLVAFKAVTLASPHEYAMPETTGDNVPPRDRTLTIHERRFNEIAVVWERTPPDADDMPVRGDGFRFTSRRESPDRVKFEVQFHDVRAAWID